MIDGEAHGTLQLVVALDPDVACRPARRPRDLVRLQHLAPA
jgi:hypothetical protein